MTDKTVETYAAAGVGGQAAGVGAVGEFERIYRANVDAVTAYFARRSADPQVVADLTAGQGVFAARDEQPVTIPLSDLAEGRPDRQRQGSPR